MGANGAPKGTQREPKVTPEEPKKPKVGPKGPQRTAKGSPKSPQGSKRDPKVVPKGAKGAQSRPKGSHRHAKDTHGKPEGQDIHLKLPINRTAAVVLIFGHVSNNFQLLCQMHRNCGPEPILGIQAAKTAVFRVQVARISPPGVGGRASC